MRSFFPDELTVLGRRRGAAGKQGEGGRVLWGGGEAFRRRMDGGGGLGQRWQRRPRRPRGGVDGDGGSGHPELRRGWPRVPGGLNWWRGEEMVLGRATERESAGGRAAEASTLPELRCSLGADSGEEEGSEGEDGGVVVEGSRGGLFIAFRWGGRRGAGCGGGGVRCPGCCGESTGSASSV